MTINEALEQIGLTKRETLIYLHLLKYGPSSPADIATQSGIKRPNIYDAVTSLEKQGLIKYQLTNKKRLIAPSPVEKIEELVTQKLTLVKNLIPALKNIDQEETFKGKVTFYQGKKAMQNLFNEAINTKSKEILGVWSSTDMDKILDKKTIINFVKKRVKKGIKVRALHHIDKGSYYAKETDSPKRQSLTQIAYIPEKFDFTLSMTIYDDVVSFYSSKKESYGFKVESKEYAKLQRMLFETLWQNSGKLNCV